MAHYKQVERFATKDGKMFDTAKKAEDHVVDSVCQLVDNILIDADRNQVDSLTHKQKIRVVTALVGDIDNIQNLQDILNKFLDMAE